MGRNLVEQNLKIGTDSNTTILEISLILRNNLS